MRWCYPEADWPPRPEAHSALKSIDHGAWSLHDAFEEEVDIVHLNDAIHLPLSRFLGMPIVQTLHHPHEPELTSLYARFPDVTYVAISESQRLAEPLARISTIHHGIQLNDYTYQAEKDDYVCFLGRMAPVKAPHLAIEAARRAGVRIKLAGEIQPVFQEYWDKAGLASHRRTGGRIRRRGGSADQERPPRESQALLFPIQWEEPFGLVMVEAMACGTPVLAFPTGSVPEVIADGINGRICDDLDEMAEWARDPRSIRRTAGVMSNGTFRST